MPARPSRAGRTPITLLWYGRLKCSAATNCRMKGSEPRRGTGKADVFVMLAHPVGHAKSPGIFNEIFEQKGLDSLMVPLSCRPEDFEAFWAGITAAENIRGLIISVPYKVAVYHKCAAAHDRA